MPSFPYDSTKTVSGKKPCQAPHRLIAIHESLAVTLFFYKPRYHTHRISYALYSNALLSIYRLDTSLASMTLPPTLYTSTHRWEGRSFWKERGLRRDEVWILHCSPDGSKIALTTWHLISSQYYLSTMPCAMLVQVGDL